MPNPIRRIRRSLLGFVGGLGAVALALSPLRSERLGKGRIAPLELLQDGRFEERRSAWGPTGAGYELVASEGRSGSRAICCASSERPEGAGAFQTLRLDRRRALPLEVTGWSKAEDVDGAPDEDYSLYASVEFQDGSRLDRIAVAFDCGTHDWQRRELRIPAPEPIKTVVLHCLFRNHRGRVWFDDLSIEEPQPPEGSLLFEGALVPPDPPRSGGLSRPRVVETRDGLRLETLENAVLSLSVDGRECRPRGPSGFLIRDVGRGESWRPLDAAALRDLELSFECRWESARDHLSIGGELRDRRGADRAISLAFAAPVELEDGIWADDVRRSRRIASTGEYLNVIPLPCGATGTLSRYPLGAVFDSRIGLALAPDLDDPLQYRVGYHAGLRRLYLSYDLGMLPDARYLPGRARFRFVLYRVDPAEGFRGALQKLYSIFPSAFARRCLDNGAWLPFTPPDQIPHWEDFGFAFHETAAGDPPAAAGPLLSFRYTEPLGLWMPLPPGFPRFFDRLLAGLGAGEIASKAMPSEVLESAVMRSAQGLPQLRFRREPWCDGVVFSVNPNPRLPGRTPLPLPDHAAGEFVDSVEGYAMAELDFDRIHLRHATASPSFSTDTRVPVLFKGQAIHEYVGAVAAELRDKGKFSFGNGTPDRFGFLAESFDILGTEVDWFPSGEFRPDADAELSYRRAMAFQKPYCILLNTRRSALTPPALEQYFQRCLFYGMFPSLFSHDAQNDSYWKDAERMEQGRPLFKKYIPLIRRTAIAGWHPVTGARSDNPAVLLERFGPDAKGVLYLTLLNESAADQEVRVTLDLWRRSGSPLSGAQELVTETAVPLRNRTLRLVVPAGETRLLELRGPASPEKAAR
jgi:hypothetical protein